MAGETVRAAPAEMTREQISATLRALGTAHKGFAFFYEPAGWHRGLRWVAERRNGMEPGLHTAITACLDELEAALASDAAFA